MRLHHNINIRFLGRGPLPAILSVHFLLYIIAASGTKAEGHNFTLPSDTEANGFRGGDNGGLQYPESEQRDSALRSTDLEGVVELSRNALSDNPDHQIGYSLRIQKYHTVDMEFERVDAIIAAERNLRGQPNEDEGPQAVMSDEGDKEKKYETKEMPRILTVLTTYSERSLFVKAYKEAVLNRSDGYEPMVSWLYGA